MKIFNQVFIVVNDADIASALVGQGGSAYADRQRMVMAEIADYDHIVVAERYGPR